MRVLHLNHSDILGGAARAAYRIHQAVRSAGMDSRMRVDVAASGDWTVQGPGSKLGKGWARVRPTVAGMAFKPFFKTGNPILH
ncbi:MAG: glycosyl transferase, partial [Gemmataceae bacterium]